MNCIAVIAKNRGIGRGNQLLFRLPGDMKYFKEKTVGKTVIMGRKTLESFPGGKALPNRRNIVLTMKDDYHKDGVTVCHSREEALELIKDTPKDDVWIIGGSQIYYLFLNDCDKAFITEVNNAGERADQFFPELRMSDGWLLTSRSEEQRDGDITYRFCVYEKE
jgi:dihydrofolate reductase